MTAFSNCQPAGTLVCRSDQLERTCFETGTRGGTREGCELGGSDILAHPKDDEAPATFQSNGPITESACPSPSATVVTVSASQTTRATFTALTLSPAPGSCCGALLYVAVEGHGLASLSWGTAWLVRSSGLQFSDFAASYHKRLPRRAGGVQRRIPEDLSRKWRTSSPCSTRR